MLELLGDHSVHGFDLLASSATENAAPARYLDGPARLKVQAVSKRVADEVLQALPAQRGRRLGAVRRKRSSEISIVVFIAPTFPGLWVRVKGVKAAQSVKVAPCRRPRLGVQRLGLFGSYLHGRPRAGSDVDLLVRFDRPSLDGYMDTRFLLEDLLGREVDLITEQALKPAVRHVRDQAAYVPGL